MRFNTKVIDCSQVLSIFHPCHLCAFLLIYHFHMLGGTQKELDEFFWKTPLGRYIAKGDLEMQTEFFQRYLQDFISMTMNVTCQADLEVVFL